MAKPKETSDVKNLAVNRRAHSDYDIEDKFEAGLSLLGTEVKSCRAGQVQLKDAYAHLQGGEIYLHRLHIAPYSHAVPEANHAPERPRKLLLKASEIRRLIGKVERSGYTLVPLRIYLKGSWIKVEIALARGRSRHEKRDALKVKLQEREMKQAVAERARR